MERPSGNGRRPSRSRSVSPVSESNVDVFDDEFAEDYAESVIAPSIGDQNPFSDPSVSSTPSQVDLPLPPTAHTESDPVQPSQQPQLPRESIRKSRGGPGNNGPPNGVDAFPRDVPVYPQRESTAQRTNSTSSIAPPLSPTDGEHGPSHPYAMYPQALMGSRTASMTTSSLYRSSSQQSGTVTNRHGPTHPYALYPQDVFGDSSDSSSTIPVGFPGHSQEFHRRLGAEGEDQDIIGPDGHTEQLPPYTRYPEAVLSRPTRLSRDQLPMIGEASQSRDSLVDSAQMSGGLGSSETTLNNSSSQLEDTTQDNSSGLGSISEKSFKNKTWKEKRKHKVCGFVPLWMILLFLVVVIVIIVICGGVIGGVFVKEIEKTRTKYHTTQPESDPLPASPIGTPTGYVDVHPITSGTAKIAPLPTGTFDLVFGTPDAKYFSCLQSGQVNAWSCELPPKRFFPVHISHKDDRWYLESGRPLNTTKRYGAQPPDFGQQNLKFVIDLDAKGLGAAYHFQTFYDKVVIVPQTFIQQTEGTSSLVNILRRDATPKNIYNANSAIVAGDIFWVCQWEDTFVEGFIYVSELRATKTPSTRAALQSTRSGSESTTGTSSIPPTSAATSGSIPTTRSSSVNTGTTNPNTTPTPNPYVLGRDSPSIYRRDGSGDHGSGDHEHGDDNSGNDYHGNSGYQHMPTTGPITGSPTSEPVTTTTTTTTKRIPTRLPNLVKIEERRLAGTHPQPLCTLHTLLDDGQLVTKPNRHGELIQILLNEDDGRNWISMQKYRLKRRQAPPPRHRHSSASQENLDSTCFCQWTSFDASSQGELVS